MLTLSILYRSIYRPMFIAISIVAGSLIYKLLWVETSLWSSKGIIQRFFYLYTISFTSYRFPQMAISLKIVPIKLLVGWLAMVFIFAGIQMDVVMTWINKALKLSNETITNQDIDRLQKDSIEIYRFLH